MAAVARLSTLVSTKFQSQVSVCNKSSWFHVQQVGANLRGPCTHIVDTLARKDMCVYTYIYVCIHTYTYKDRDLMAKQSMSRYLGAEGKNINNGKPACVIRLMDKILHYPL